MNRTAIVFVLLFCIVAFLVFRRMKTKEGFESAKEEPLPRSGAAMEPHPLVGVMGTIRRLSTKLMDISMWKERIAMSNMSPVELARLHLKSIATSEDA